ncbi:MAG TPA: fatty acid desaturase [Polyangiales bacterium]|nr:fatty acid desaturase [Polyangiales bacterium]
MREALDAAEAASPDLEPEVVANQAYAHGRKNLLSTARVRELSRLRPWRPLLDALGCWAVILASWTLVAVRPNWWSVALAIPLIGTRYYALFILGHDGLHRRLFSAAKHNDLFSDLLVFGPIGAITRLNNKNHLDHHRYLATSSDPDRHKHASFNKTSALELIGFLSGASSVLRSVYNVFIGSRAPRQPNASRRGYTLRDLVILLSWQVVLIGGLSVAIGFWAWPVLWLLPVYVFAFLADNARSFLEHSHPESDSLADQHRLITYRSNALERMFFAPLHMNYHAAHHLWPSIPYYNLPLADRELRQLPAASMLEQRGSYLAYLWRYYRALPLASGRESERAR